MLNWMIAVGLGIVILLFIAIQLWFYWIYKNQYFHDRRYFLNI